MVLQSLVHLRSGRPIASSSIQASQVSTQGSGTRTYKPLEPIEEELSFYSIEAMGQTRSKSSNSMGDSASPQGLTIPFEELHSPPY